MCIKIVKWLKLMSLAILVLHSVNKLFIAGGMLTLTNGGLKSLQQHANLQNNCQTSSETVCKLMHVLVDTVDGKWSTLLTHSCTHCYTQPSVFDHLVQKEETVPSPRVSQSKLHHTLLSRATQYYSYSTVLLNVTITITQLCYSMLHCQL